MSIPEVTLRAARRRELGAFLLLAAVLAPFVTFLLVSAYGLVVWIWYMIHGPPGPAAL
jgi:periplasmic nitrate reductase NapE